MTNPLLDDWTTPFGVAPFDAISDADFAPALEAALAEHNAAVREYQILNRARDDRSVPAPAGQPASR